MSSFPTAMGSPAGLRGLLWRVWNLADGQRPVPQIARDAAASLDQVLEALDLLDHVGLLDRDTALQSGLPAPAAWAGAAGLALAPLRAR